VISPFSPQANHRNYDEITEDPIAVLPCSELNRFLSIFLALSDWVIFENDMFLEIDAW
jgi:hypothetical protein